MTNNPRRMVYSYSSLNCYDSICPHQFYRRYVAKDIKFVETPAVSYGNAVHSAMEHRIGGGKPLPDGMQQWEPIAAAFDGRGAKTEVKLGMTADYGPADFWGDNVWIRGKLDLVIVNHVVAYMADWKTGKVREEPFELELGAMLLCANYPDITTVVGNYYWLKESKVGRSYTLSGTGKTLRKCNEIVAAIENDRVFEKRPGPLCGWCSVLDCEFNRAGKS